MRWPFEIAKADAIMASYNAVNGIPMTANPIFRTLVQKKWGFDGLIDTDRGAVTSLVTNHKFYPDMQHAVAGAMHADVNQFLNPYEEALRGAVTNHLVTQEEIDENLRGLLRVLAHAGLLDSLATGPYAHHSRRRNCGSVGFARAIRYADSHSVNAVIPLKEKKQLTAKRST